jgi:hypothetical protein
MPNMHNLTTTIQRQHGIEDFNVSTLHWTMKTPATNMEEMSAMDKSDDGDTCNISCQTCTISQPPFWHDMAMRVLTSAPTKGKTGWWQIGWRRHLQHFIPIKFRTTILTRHGNEDFNVSTLHWTMETPAKFHAKHTQDSQPPFWPW